MKKSLFVFIKIVGIVSGLFLALIVGFYVLLIFCTGETTTTWGYTSRITDLKKHAGDLWDYFPDSIPKEATNVRFCYSPGLGDQNMQLRYVLPANEITELYDKYSRTKLLSYPGGSPPAGLSGEFRPISGSDPTLIGIETPDFEFFRFDQRPHGIAINRKTNEIFFWMLLM